MAHKIAADLPSSTRYEFDAAYLAQLTAGDPEVERHFTEYFSALLLAKLRSRLRSPTLVEDARQETFLRVLTTLRTKGGLTSPGGLGAFVNTVCNNVLFELYRSESKLALVLDDEGAPEPEASDESVELKLLSQETRTRVRLALDELPEKDRTLLQWLFFEERDKNQICRELGVDREYLRVLVHRAKARVRQVLASR
jgi:RNA polymerase sigma-70 factor, ECF subfamily